jgi:AcrR family transcriptional regulator
MAAIAACDAILAAAEQLLAAHGPAALMTNRIAERAGVSVGTLYHYFPNKEAIARALHERVLAAAVAVVPRVIATSPGAPPRAVALALADAFVDLYVAQPPIHRWLWEMRGAIAAHGDLYAAMTEQTAHVERALAALGAADAGTLAFVLVHAFDGLASAIASRAYTIDARAAARTLAEVIATYLEAQLEVTAGRRAGRAATSGPGRA